jgi:hypothetical protein
VGLSESQKSLVAYPHYTHAFACRLIDCIRAEQRTFAIYLRIVLTLAYLRHFRKISLREMAKARSALETSEWKHFYADILKNNSNGSPYKG